MPQANVAPQAPPKQIGTQPPAQVTYSVKTNKFNDQLPIIPSESRVVSHAVLYRLDLDITITIDNKPAEKQLLIFIASGKGSTAKQLKPTDADGKAVLRLETRTTGVTNVRPRDPQFQASVYFATLTEAWYEAGFLITAYNCCDEGDFSGDLVDAPPVGKHKKDFLFGGRGICMQGTGLGSDGRYIRVNNPTQIAWAAHHASVSDTSVPQFAYTDGVHGAFAVCTANHSIAIDPHILPSRHRVYIYGPRELGERHGDDTGGGIHGHHFDNYAGAGKAVVDAWTAAGGNIDNAKVKYLGA